MRVSAKSDYALRALIEIAGGADAGPTSAGANVIRAVDGPLVSVYDARPEAVEYSGSAEILQLVWIAARSSLREVFESVTLDALVDQELPDAVTARTHDEDAWLPH